VPLFFIISSFLFFSKYNAQSQALEKRQRILVFVKRNLQLYFCWFVLLFPATVYIRGYYQQSIGVSIVRVLRDFLFGSTFLSSWFLMANLLGITIILGLSKVNNHLAGIIAVFLYILCMLKTCYGNLLPTESLLYRAFELYPATFYQSFPIGVFWAYVGKRIAEIKEYRQNITILGLGISILLLVIEWNTIEKRGLLLVPGYCFMMVPVCIFLVLLIKKIQTNIDRKHSMFLRHLSTIIYCLSTTVGYMLEHFIEKVVPQFGDGLIHYQFVFWATVLICIVITIMVDFIKKFRLFKWMKYMY